MQDACHNKPNKYDLTLHESPSNLVVRVPDQCTGGHGFPVGESDAFLYPL